MKMAQLDAAADPASATLPTTTFRGGQMLTFGLAGETYGVAILRVREIRGWTPVTVLPNSPAHLLGVLNLRGAVVPVIDLRRVFGLPSVEFTAKTVVIVLTLHAASGTQDCGIVVDRVADVVDVDPARVKPPPYTHQRPENRFIDGLATMDRDMLVLLKLDDLVSPEIAQVMTGDAS
jgi:purine-binding chemotaxis protein CheW